MSEQKIQENPLPEHALVEKAALFVESLLKNESSGHDWEHIRRVWINARNIAREESGADILAVELAALLHDIDDWKLTGKPMDSEPEQAESFLSKAGAPNDLIQKVCSIIQAIDYRGAVTSSKLKTLEDKIVHDADKLDAVGAIGIARCFAFTGNIGRPIFLPRHPPPDNIDEKIYTDLKRENNTAINHFFDKLLRLKERMATQTGKKLAQDRHETMVVFLRAFFREYGLPEWENRLDEFLSRQKGS